MRLDALDVRIVRLLQEDARLSLRESAERLGSTTPPVSARVQGLEDIGLLRGYRAEIDPTVLGATAYALALTVQPAGARQAFEALRALPGLQSAHLLPGGRLVGVAHLRPPAYGLAHLHEALAAIPGLVTYDASEAVDALAARPIAELPETVDIPCHQCKGPIHGDPVRGRLGERLHVFCCRQCLADFRERFEARQAGAQGKPKGARGR